MYYELNHHPPRPSISHYQQQWFGIKSDIIDINKKLVRLCLLPIDNDCDVADENNNYDNVDNYNENNSNGNKYHCCSCDDNDDTADDIDDEDDERDTSAVMAALI